MKVKRFGMKVVSLAAVMMVLFTSLFALPVYAYVLEDYIWGGNIPDGGWTWAAIRRSVALTTDYLTLQESGAFDDRIVDPSQGDGGPFSGSRTFYTASGAGGTAGGRGYEYTIAPSGGGTAGGRSGVVDTYNAGATTRVSLVNQTYNTTTNNYDYTFNKITNTFNNTTNNYYETHNIKNIYYNNTYNTYRLETTNNYNYFLTYSPTFVNVTYLDSATSVYQSDFYFYELPDGRNSWDLTADDVFGMYFLYDAINYDMVNENALTSALYHFDGSIKDESAYDGTASYLEGASYNYVDHAGFGSALYWDGGAHSLKFDLGVGAQGISTLEFMLYASASAAGVPLRNTSFTTSSTNFTLDVRYPDYFLPEGYSYTILNPGTWNSVRDGKNWIQSKTATIQYERIVGHLLTIDGQEVLPIVISGQARLDDVITYFYGTYPNGADYENGSSRTETFAITSASITIGVGSQTLPVGSWAYISCVDKGGEIVFYLNGVSVGSASGSFSDSSFVIHKPAEWNNYWYLDEVRASSSVLYEDSYVPQSHPFDANKVMVLPATGVDGDIAIKSSVPVGDMRVGGARPTYPAVGDVFINVEKESDTVHTVTAAQQYQAGGWVAVDASIRVNGEWVHLKDYNLHSFVAPAAPDGPPGGDDSSGGGSGGDDSSGSGSGGGGSGSESGGGSSGDIPDEDDDGFWSWIWEGIGNFFKGFFNGLKSLLGAIVSFIGDVLGGLLENVLKLAADLLGGLGKLITSLFDTLFSLVDFSTRFGNFLTESFSFIPAEIIGVIVLGLSLAVILMIVRFIRG